MLVTGGVIPTQKRILTSMGLPVGDVRTPLSYAADDDLVASVIATGWIDGQV
jgi:hypothetical protein